MSLDPKAHRLFVEGPSDGAVVNKLVLRRLGVDLAPKARQIVSAGGNSAGGFQWVRDQLEAALVTRKFERFGAVIDRDAVDGKPDRWLSVRELLGAHGVAVGELSPSGFLGVTGWGARIGIWVMPDNGSPGDLESFLEGLVPAGAQDWPWAGEAAETAQALGAAYQAVHARKARFHTWLAWRDPPGSPYGTAIEARQLGESSPAADAFVGWFGRLFLEP